MVLLCALPVAVPKKVQLITQVTIGGSSWYLTSKARYIHLVEVPAKAILRYFPSLGSASSPPSEFCLFKCYGLALRW